MCTFAMICWTFAISKTYFETKTISIRYIYTIIEDSKLPSPVH